MTTCISPKELAKVGHWVGELNLTMASKHGKTVVQNKQQRGPYSIQRALYPEADQSICHLLILHPPGGLVQADSLELNVLCKDQAHAFLTTPSSGKVYRSSLLAAKQRQRFKVTDGAKLEWFPQELILYEGSISKLKTVIELEGHGQFFGWEIICLGHRAESSGADDIEAVQSIEVHQNKRMSLIDRLVIKPDNNQQTVFASQWGLACHKTVGTLIVSQASDDELQLARDVCANTAVQCRVGITLVDGLLVCRGLAMQSRFLKAIFLEIWQALRQRLIGATPHSPRIWQT